MYFPICICEFSLYFEYLDMFYLGFKKNKVDIVKNIISVKNNNNLVYILVLCTYLQFIRESPSCFVGLFYWMA